VTNDFATTEPVLNFFMGGLNHHIAHHLFPTVNHISSRILPGISKKRRGKETCLTGVIRCGRSWYRISGCLKIMDGSIVFLRSGGVYYYAYYQHIMINAANRLTIRRTICGE
jgi:hypothetical protein